MSFKGGKNEEAIDIGRFKDLIPIKDEELQKAHIPFKAKTLMHWRAERKNLDLFVKIGGRVFFNLRRYAQRIEEAEQEAIESEIAEREREERFLAKIL